VPGVIVLSVHQQRPQQVRSRMGCLLGLSIFLLVLFAAGGFVVPVIVPQPTCDLLGSMMGCDGGETATCVRVTNTTRRGTSMNVSVRCPEGPKGAGPIWAIGGISLGIGMLQFLVVIGLFVASSVKRTREARLTGRS
jgi:hypothetical protein